MTQHRAETPAHLREIREGADVFGSDGEHWGRVEDVGAKYLTITEGILGRKEFYLPIALVACGDADRVELRVPAAQAKAAARSEVPDDEPIYADAETIPVGRMESLGIPAPDDANVTSAHAQGEQDEHGRRFDG